jgi:hypothetical protein
MSDDSTLKGREFNAGDISDLSAEVQEVAVFALQMREKNAATVERIQSLGGDVDLATAKLEHTLIALVDMGVLTPLQMWQIESDWERKLRKMLKPILERMQGLHQERIKQQQENRLGKKLILPPGVKKE